MPIPIDPIRMRQESADDANWKRDVDRLAQQLVAWKEEVDSRLKNLEGRVN